MSNPDAVRLFMNAAGAFHAMEGRLRDGDPGIDPRSIDETLIDVEASIPGLTEIDLGRALIFKGYALWWKYHVEMQRDARAGKLTPLDVARAGVDPKITEGLEAASKGQQLIQQYGEPYDRAWADDVVKKLGSYS